MVLNSVVNQRDPVHYCKPCFLRYVLISSSSSSSSSCSWRIRRVSCSLILKIKLVPPSLPWSFYVPLSFGLRCNACFGILFVFILCTCCSHFSWYCFMSFTMFCAPVFSLIHWFFSLSGFVIPSKCLKNFICAASKRCSSLFFSSQTSLPNFSASLAVMLWILNFVSLFIVLKLSFQITLSLTRDLIPWRCHDEVSVYNFYFSMFKYLSLSLSLSLLRLR